MEKELRIKFSQIERNELSDIEKTLHEAAINARKNAYAPYSHFNVGCAVLLENGEIVTGNNQENAAFPSGLCAERVAIFKAGADNPGVAVSAVYISCDDQSGICAPCGSCRQALMEYESKQEFPIQIWIPGGDGKFIMLEAVKDLLPFPFSLNK